VIITKKIITNNQYKSLNLLNIIFLILLFSCKHNFKNEKINKTTLSAGDSIVFYNLLDSLNSNYCSNNEELIRTSDKIISKFPENIANSDIKIAHIHFNKENYYLAKYYFIKAAEEFNKNNMMPEYAEQLSNIGVVLEISGFYSQALEKYYDALKIFKKLNLAIKIARVSNNIGIIYQQLNEGDKAIEFYKKALVIAKQQKRENIMANSYNNIATYFEEFKNDYDSALIYYKKAHEIYLKQPISPRLLTIENNICNNYLLKNEIHKADTLLKTLLQKSLDNGFQDRISPILNNQATLNILQENYSEAIAKAEKSLKLAVKMGNKKLQLQCLSILTGIYEKQKDYKKYSNLIKRQLNLKEELNGLELKKQINILNVKYEVDNKQSQIEILKLNNDVKSREIVQLWLFIIIIILLLGGTFFVFYLYKKNNKLINNQMRRDITDYINKINEFETERQSIKQQLINNKDNQILKQTKSFDLTERENDVLLLIAKGYTNTKIADTLFVSVNTVKYHTKNIFIKLDVKNRIEAVQKAQGISK